MSFYLRHYLFCSASFFIGSIKSCFISTSIFRHFNSPKFLFIFTFFTEITLYTIIINYYITWFKLTTAITLIFPHVDIMNHLVPSPIFSSNNCFPFIHLSIITHCKQIIQYFSNPTFSYRNPLLSGLKSFKPNLTIFMFLGSFSFFLNLIFFISNMFSIFFLFFLLDVYHNIRLLLLLF